MLQHHILGSKYPIERAAYYLVTAVTLLLVLLWKRSGEVGRRAIRLPAEGAFYVFTALFLTHFALSANVSHFHTWKYDASTRLAVMDLTGLERGERGEGGDAPAPLSVRVGADWVFAPALNYYRYKFGLVWMAPVRRSGPEGRFDYYYLMDSPKNRALMERYRLRVIKRYGLSGTVLAEPRGEANIW